MSSYEPITGGRTCNCKRRPRQEPGQPSQKLKHLYLVLDDWDEGLTIRKLAADDIPDDPLSAPPAVRLLSPAPHYAMSVAALGSHILAASNRHPATLVYDTATAALAAGPSLPDALLNASNTFFPTADDTLYAFAYHYGEKPQSVEVMSSSSAERSPVGSSTRIPSRDWSWRTQLAPSPFAEEERVWSYALHPDGHTVFVSAVCCSYNGGRRTFSFDTAAGDRTEWRCHGEWALPFKDYQGCYDADLDAWVGLGWDGRIGTCQVPSTVPHRRQQRPELDWKVAKDDLRDDERGYNWIARRPTLTCMGNARFCLVDCLIDRELDDCRNCVLRITTFRLRHSRKGELQIFDRNSTSCPMYKSRTSFSPVAFWI